MSWLMSSNSNTLKNEGKFVEEFQELVKDCNTAYLTTDFPENLMEINIVMKILHIVISLAVPAIIIGIVFLCIRILKWMLNLR